MANVLERRDGAEYVSESSQPISHSDTLLARLGARVRAARLVRRWSLRQLAARTRLSERFLGKLETGRGNTSVRNLTQVATALDTSAAKLLADDEPFVRPPVIALVGMRGAGKSCAGQRLARRLKLAFIELDRRVEEAAGLRLSEIFAVHGEHYYGELERAALHALLDQGVACVLAVGGGLVTDPELWALLRARAFTIWLRADPRDYWNRVVAQGDCRPMAKHPAAMQHLEQVLCKREPVYSLAHVTIATSKSRLDQTVKAALLALA